jgi:branched-subunit amino acid aminotransferase/4-amino-4-deoxychorismate lyase
MADIGMNQTPDARSCHPLEGLLSFATPIMAEIWCNHEWLPADRYPGAAQDRGAFLGLGLFETMLAVDGVLVFADRHLARLHQSCARLGWSVAISDLREIARELLVRNGLANGPARLRLVVTAGSGPHNDLAPGPDRLLWLAAFPMTQSDDPITACLSPWPRNERSPIAGLKTSCYAENLIALDRARRDGFDEAVFINTAGQLCESATANLFLVKDGALFTPSLESGCLPGIGREVICEIAARAGMAVSQCALTLSDIQAADEIFLSSATRGPVGVRRFEDRHFPALPVTAAVRLHWREEVERCRGAA